MHEIKMYKLKPHVPAKPFPGFSVEKVKNLETITSQRDTAFDFLPKDTVFSPLVLRHFGDSLADTSWQLTDLHMWIRQRIWPTRYIVSQRLRELLCSYKLYEHAFYSAMVDYDGCYVPYHILHMKWNLNFTNWISYEHSVFGNGRDIEKKISTLNYKVDNEQQLLELQKRKGWRKWGFVERVMRSDFADYDLVRVSNPYSYIMSERLRDKIIENKLIGIDVDTEPIIFKIVESDV